MIKSDLLKVIREPFFLLILIAPFPLAIVLRYFLPELALQFQTISLPDYYPLIIVLFVLVSPLYYGFVLALQLLEEKDENVLLAVAVTPLPLRTYLFARIAVFTLVSLPVIVLVHQIIGLADVSIPRLLLIACAASLNTPLLVMLLAALAKNQLEGFVIGKGLGFIILLPMVMFFVPDYWHLLCGVLPTYWPIIAYYTAVAEDGSTLFFALAIVMSLVVQPAATLVLYRKFERELVNS